VPFKPSCHGWPFANTLAVHPSTLGLGAPPARELGLGAGMCWAALDRYRAGLRIPRDLVPPEPGEPLHHELVRRNAAALAGVWVTVQEWQRLTDRELGFRSRATWRWLRSHLAEREPVLLTILPEADPYQRARAAWHVLATGWTVIEERVVLSLYDPGRPGEDDLHLGFSMVGPLDARLTGARDIRGFFPVPYDREAFEPAYAESVRAEFSPGREVYGQVAVATSGVRLEVVSRTQDGALVHHRRRRGGPWQTSIAMAPDDSGLDALQGDPAILIAGGRVHAFARSYVGDLMHFQRALRWTAANRTREAGTGPRYRLAGRPVPVASSTGGLRVFARDPSGGIVHYSAGRIGGWAAERLEGGPIVGDPLTARVAGSLHLFGLTGEGRILHWKREGKSWLVNDVIESASLDPRLKLAGQPVVLVRDQTVYLFGRDTEDRLLHLRRSPTGHWNAMSHAVTIVGDPAAVSGPGGIHLFATTPDGGLNHRWGETVWQGEDLAAARPHLELPRPCARPVLAWGTDQELKVFAHWAGQLIMLGWREDADWEAVPLRLRPGADDERLPAHDLVLVRDGRDRFHLFGAALDGSLAHVESRPWTEPVPPVTVEAADAEVPDTAPALATAGTTRPALVIEVSGPHADAADPGRPDSTEEAPAMAARADGEPPAPDTGSPGTLPVPDTAPSSAPQRPPGPPRRSVATRSGGLIHVEPVGAGTAPRDPGAAGRAPDAAAASVTASPDGEDPELMDISLLDTWPDPPTAVQRWRGSRRA
jgi:hypothetical protein